MTELPNRLLRDALDRAAAATPSPACLDAGALAAWADGTMRAAARADVEAHAAGCARCLALLAAMVRTEPPPLERAKWRVSLPWLLPLATAAAALLIVVPLVLIEQRPPAGQAVAPPPIGAPQAPPLEAPAPEPAGAAAKPSVPPVAVNVPAPRRRESPAPGGPTMSASVRLKTEVAAAPVAAPAPSAPIAAKDAAPSPAAPALTPSPPAAAESISPLREEMARSQAGANALTALPASKAAVPAPIVIASSDPRSQWRIVGGVVEHTADGGASWQRQPIDAAARMRAGAAPGPLVCWLAGSGGVVMRTTDGTTWTRIPFPETADLVAIEASDAAHATVTTSAGARVTTSDGGATWTRR